VHHDDGSECTEAGESNRLEAESKAERFRRLIEGSGTVGVALFDVGEFVLLDANVPALELLGERRRARDVRGSKLIELAPGCESSGLADLFRKVAASGEPYSSEEYYAQGLRHGAAYWSFSLIPMAATAGGDPENPDLARASFGILSIGVLMAIAMVLGPLFKGAGHLLGAPVPEGGFFLWLDVGDGEAAAVRLWQEAGVRTIPGAYLCLPAADGANPGRSFLRVALVQDLETTTEALARMAHWSPAHFSEEFRRHFGAAPIAYLIRQRMAHARHLLRDVGLTVADVAQRVGYDDLYHFSKLFKKHCGISPGAVREKGSHDPRKESAGPPVPD